MKRKSASWLGSKSWIFPLIIFLSIGFLNPVPGAGLETVDETASFIPDSLVVLTGAPVIVVDKTMQRLFVYRFDGNSFQRLYEAACSTGKNQGTKVQSGDARTPEGIYFPTQLFQDSELSATYGPLAFDLSYPNALDRKEGKNGNNIWLHGTDKSLKPFQSNGCIALGNGDITAIADFITLNATPVIIHDYIRWVNPSIRMAQKKDIISCIDTWSRGVCSGDVQQMTELYGKDCRHEEERHGRFAEQMLTLKRYGGQVALIPEDLMLLKHDKYVVALFRQQFTVNDHSYDAGLRKLFLKKRQNDWYIAGDVPVESGKERRFMAVLEKINADRAYRDDVRRLIDTWATSWQEGDMEKYASFYAKDFRSRKMNRNAWLAYKERLSRLNSNIRIDIKDLTIRHQSHHRAIAIFEQHYRSSRVQDVGMKTLYLKYVDNSWKICQEVWRVKR